MSRFCHNSASLDPPRRGASHFSHPNRPPQKNQVQAVHSHFLQTFFGSVQLIFSSKNEGAGGGCRQIQAIKRSQATRPLSHHVPQEQEQKRDVVQPPTFLELLNMPWGLGAALGMGTLLHHLLDCVENWNVNHLFDGLRHLHMDVLGSKQFRKVRRTTC